MRCDLWQSLIDLKHYTELSCTYFTKLRGQFSICRRKVIETSLLSSLLTLLLTAPSHQLQGYGLKNLAFCVSYMLTKAESFSCQRGGFYGNPCWASVGISVQGIILLQCCKNFETRWHVNKSSFQICLQSDGLILRFYICYKDDCQQKF